ncbi:zinc ribbon domain-containing protein [bacterium 1xD8-6]|jgi:hypothetical protein|nr:zinc ribbon domain-containing protein [Lachnospiraceae bacterium]RKI30652.1 zinc ribbon domain-containing protein [bacterium D16-36]RKI73033.1 zinc ribbon domain-containing protein [bacterium 1xD8-6]
MIFLILLLIVILAVFCGILYVRHKAKEFSRTIFGTEDLSDGIRQMKREYASTPKSVSGMTNLLLPKIVSDFPDFEYDEMKERAENTLTQYLRAVTQKNTAVLTDGNTELKQQLENHIQMLSIKGLWEHFDQIKIHRTEIHQYKKADGRCIITFQSALECFHYITDTSSVIEGSKEYKYQTKYNTDLIYIQDRNLLENELDHALGINCPNCGAPLSSLGAKKCEYCGTPVIEINIHAWSFSDIKEMN